MTKKYKNLINILEANVCFDTQYGSSGVKNKVAQPKILTIFDYTTEVNFSAQIS
jgi:hypothetical protein